MIIQSTKSILISALLAMGMWFTSFAQAQNILSKYNLEYLFKHNSPHDPQFLLKSEFGTGTQVTTWSPLFEISVEIQCASGAPCNIGNQLHLPDGVLIQGYELDYFDLDAANDLLCIVVYTPHNAFQTGAMGTELFAFTSAGTPGATPSGIIAPSVTHIVDNDTNVYLQTCERKVDAVLPVSTKLYWKRAISSAPGAASFSDVPVSHPFYQAVEAMVASGVTGGCGGGKYCPDATVTRGQMAAFMARALGL